MMHAIIMLITHLTFLPMTWCMPYHVVDSFNCSSNDIMHAISFWWLIWFFPNDMHANCYIILRLISLFIWGHDTCNITCWLISLFIWWHGTCYILYCWLISLFVWWHNTSYVMLLTHFTVQRMTWHLQYSMLLTHFTVCLITRHLLYHVIDSFHCSP